MFDVYVELEAGAYTQGKINVKRPDGERSANVTFLLSILGLIHIMA